MPQLELHNAVNQAITDLGKDIIKSPNFASILLDYHAYPKDPILSAKQKNAMKDILAEGYGEKVYDWSSGNHSKWKKENERILQDFLRRTMHEKEVVDTISQALLYGAGCLSLQDIGAESAEPAAESQPSSSHTPSPQQASATPAEKPSRKKKWFRAIKIGCGINLGLVVLLVVLALIFGNLNSPESEQYERTIAQADSLAQLGQIDTALLVYQSAIDNYKSDYLLSTYQDEVAEKRSKLLHKHYYNVLQAQCKANVKHPTVGACFNINQRMMELPGDSLLSKEEIAEKDKIIAQVEDMQKQAIASQTDVLLKNISENKGKVDSRTRNEIDTLLLCAPDDYWLNMIKKKAK